MNSSLVLYILTLKLDPIAAARQYAAYTVAMFQHDSSWRLDAFGAVVAQELVVTVRGPQIHLVTRWAELTAS